jgi:hypothetical protein
VIASHVRGPETPAPVQADFPQSLEYDRSAVSVQRIGCLVHLVAHHSDTLRTGFRQSAAGNIVIPVYRTGFVAVQMHPIASESDEVPLAGVLSTAPLQARLGLACPDAGMLPRIYRFCVAHPRTCLPLPLLLGCGDSPRLIGGLVAAGIFKGE